VSSGGAPASIPAPYGQARARRGTAVLTRLRSSEWLLLGYFLYAAALRAPLGALALGVGLLVGLLAWAESRSRGRFCGIARDWLPLPFILVAYWTVDWTHTSAHTRGWERSWVTLDKLLLNDWGGRRAIEYFGAVLPFALDLCYSLLWALPAVGVGVLYLYRKRERVDRFVFPLLLGTLLTYALLPHFPSQGPTLLFPGQDLPRVHTVTRAINLWVLQRFDIRTSVFPSGHVTVAFSAAFAMLLALPEKKGFGGFLVLVAVAVAVATVYDRYHYAVDGLAGLAVSITAVGLSALLRRLT